MRFLAASALCLASCTFGCATPLPSLDEVPAALPAAWVSEAAEEPKSESLASGTASDADLAAADARKVAFAIDAQGIGARSGPRRAERQPFVGHAWLDEGENETVEASLDEAVASGDMLMLMVHGETGGMKEREFEYTLGAKEDGPIRVDGKLVTATITAN